jgi:alpha-D-ribose 1-methylphosphonate 5-triphosphate synthase subunit PhnI
MAGVRTQVRRRVRADQLGRHVHPFAVYVEFTFSLSDKVTAASFVKHKAGHTESTDFTVDIDEKAFMSAPQKTAKRYSLCHAFGIATGEEDDEGPVLERVLLG